MSITDYVYSVGITVHCGTKDMPIVKLDKDEKTGELILPLDDPIFQDLNWKVGDAIQWTDNGDGSWTMSKKQETELVLVECVSQFRMRYVVEVPKGKSSWALDTVAMNEATELSQEHIGENIISHRVIDKEEYLRVFNLDNDYLKSWDNEKKFSFIHKIKETESET